MISLVWACESGYDHNGVVDCIVFDNVACSRRNWGRKYRWRFRGKYP